MAEIDDDTKSPSTDDELGTQFKRHYRAAKKHQGEWLKMARESYEYIAGRQLPREVLDEVEDDLKPYVTFNRIDPVVSAVVGHQINNRQELKYIPRNQGDAQPNEIMTGAANYIDDESDATDEITEAFWDMAVCGMGWTETHIEYDEEPEGKIYGAERVPPLEMGWDPASKKRNLANARYIFREAWWPRKEAIQKWPKLKDVQLPDGGMGWLNVEDDPIQESPREDYDGYDAGNWYRETNDSVLIVQYQYYELKPVYVVGDPISNKPIEMDESMFRRLKDRIDRMGARYVRQMRREYYQCIMAGVNVLEKTQPCKIGFTFRCMTGKRDETKNFWYGVVQAMKDPQMWSNKVFSDITSIMYKNRTGGAFVETDALADPRKAEEQWSEESPLIMLNPGALQKGKVLERQPINYPAGLDRLMEFAVQSIPQVTGISMELLGLVDRQQAGVLEMQRKRAGMTILAIMFNSLKRYGKERGRILKFFIDEYMPENTLVRIVGSDGLEKYVPMIKDKEVQKYDMIVDEAPSSPNQKQETFLVLTELVPQMAKLGIQPPEEMIDYLPLPAMMIEKWKQSIKESKNDPMAKRLRELDIAEREAAVNKDNQNAEKFSAEAALKRVEAMIKQMMAPLEARVQEVEQLSKIAERSKPN